MGILADIKAMRDIQKIKYGGTANISMASITNMIINVQEARKNLSKDEFNDFYQEYLKMQKCKTKLVIDYEGYLKICFDILRRFDEIAPCELYLGLEGIEAEMLMSEIRESLI